MPSLPPPDAAPAVIARLRRAGCVFAEDEAALLIEAALLVAAADMPSRLEDLVRQRVDGVPLEYLLGWVEFRGRRVGVEPGVFVPRRRTEFLAELAEACAGDLAARRDSEVRVVELCCGNGAVAQDLLARVPAARVWAVDLDPVAVRCAGSNLDPDRADVLLGDLYAPLPEPLRGKVDVVVANAPYVPTDEVGLMPREARDHEARRALDGGVDGLDVLRRVIAGAPRWLTAEGVLLVETSERQADALGAAAVDAGLAARISRDAERGAVVLSARSPRSPRSPRSLRSPRSPRSRR